MEYNADNFDLKKQTKLFVILIVLNQFLLLDLTLIIIKLIIMYSYHMLINPLSTHMIHINLNMIWIWICTLQGPFLATV